MENPNYYAIIPAEVRYAPIKANSKLLYGEITALCNTRGYCWASNAYFSNLYCVSERQVSKWIQELVDNGFIYSIVSKEEGNKRYITIEQKFQTYRTKVLDPYRTKVLHNNTSNNNTCNSGKSHPAKTQKKEKIKSEREEETLDLFLDEYSKIKNYDSKKIEYIADAYHTLSEQDYTSLIDFLENSDNPLQEYEKCTPRNLRKNPESFLRERYWQEITPDAPISQEERRKKKAEEYKKQKEHLSKYLNI